MKTKRWRGRRIWRKERRQITNSVSMAFTGQGESNSRFHSPLINHHLIILKQKKIKSSLRETQISLSLLLLLSENPSHVSPADRLPPALTIRHPAIGSCISRSRRPWGRAACPCGLWPVSVSAPPSGPATLSARPGRGRSDTPLRRDRSCSSGTCWHKECDQEGIPRMGF